MRELSRLTSRVFNTPLAIAPDKAAVIAAVLSAKIGGESLVASVEGEDGSEPVELEISPNGIAQLSICGTLVERSSWLDAYCGMVSYDAIAQQLAAAESDARVRGILLVIDSPGGEVSGMFECARALAAVTKPMYAVVNYCACSAAYLLASQADLIFVTESSLAGSIGVIAQHMETSAWDAEAGIKYTTIFAGARKNDGNPREPLSEGARNAIQADVDDVMQKFVASVAQARGVPEESIRATEAGIFRGEHVITAGLADHFGSRQQAEEALENAVRSQSGLRGIASESDGGRVDYAAVAALCDDAGQPEALVKFIKAGLTAQQAMEAALERLSRKWTADEVAQSPTAQRLIADARERAERFNKQREASAAAATKRSSLWG